MVPMPFINLKTNTAVSDDQATKLKAAFGQDITAIPGKSEAWLMVEISPENKLYFKGSDEPAAIAEVSVFGNAAKDALEDLTAKICDSVEDALGIPSSRIYVKYDLVPNWGWNGGNF